MIHTKQSFRLALAGAAILVSAAVIQGQPSGGPYGPIRQMYEVPLNAKTVYYVAPDGRADAAGESIETPTSIESAIVKAVTGDAIILRGGTYRTGNLVFNQGITLQPYRDEQPVFKGTRISTEWEGLPGKLWRTKWETLFPLPPAPWWEKARNLRSTPVYLFNNDMVFVDGKLLKTKGYPAELDENSFCVDYEDGYVYIGADPTHRTVEITAYDNALTRIIGEVNGNASDRIGPTIRGIIFTQYAYRAIEIEGYDPARISSEQEHGKDVLGTVLEHCTLSYCSRVGAYLRGDDMVIRHNLVTDTGTEGLFILSSNDALLEKNIVTRNNEEGIQGYFATAVKIFNQCYRVICNDNLIIDNKDSSGIWYDVGNVDGVFINNYVENTDNGFFFEISKGIVCAGNVFVNCNTGSHVLNSSGAKVYQNTYVNSRATFDRSNRGADADHFGWHPQSGPAVNERHGHAFGNNLIVADDDFNSSLLNVHQDPILGGKLTDPMFEYADNNVYVRGRVGSPPGNHESPIISWAPVTGDDCNRQFDTLAAFQSLVPGFESNSVSMDEYDGPLFQSKQLGNYGLAKGFADQSKTAPLPGFVAEVLSDVYNSAGFPGAFPPVEP